MTYVLSAYERDQSAVKGVEWTFTLPDILLESDDSVQSVPATPADSDPITWEITLVGFPAGMSLGTGDTGRSISGFYRLTSGQLSSVDLRWTPSATQAFYLEDGRQRRPRVWAVAVQVDGTGAWADRQFEFGLVLTCSDRVLHAQELRDAASIAAYGEQREINLPWYHSAHLSEALERRYLDPPRMVGVAIPLVQETEGKLTDVLGIEPGQQWVVGTSATDAAQTMLGMVTSVELQIPASGMAVKRVYLIEAIHDGVVISINTFALAVNGVELAIGGNR